MNRAPVNQAAGAAGLTLLALLGLLAAVHFASAQDAPKQHESNFGRVILANCDLIVEGVAAAQRQRVSGGFRVEITVQSTLHGKLDKREFALFYTDPALLKEKEAVRALFAVKRMAEGGFSLIGKPVLVPEGEAETQSKREVCEAFIALEGQPQGDARTAAFWDLLLRHLRLGGYEAQNAAVELMFVARDRSSLISEERFAELQDARKAAEQKLTRLVKADIALASQGMVEATIKGLKYRRIRRGETSADRRAAADELHELVKAYPRAFQESDANLCNAMAQGTEDAVLRARLEELRQAVVAEVRIRQARERADRD